jgi:hypothetical protein
MRATAPPSTTASLAALQVSNVTNA